MWDAYMGFWAECVELNGHTLQGWDGLSLAVLTEPVFVFPFI